MQEKDKSHRGGRREGAGRPSGRKDVRSITIRLPEDVAEILEKHGNKSAFIIDAIRAFQTARNNDELV